MQSIGLSKQRLSLQVGIGLLFSAAMLTMPGALASNECLEDDNYVISESKNIYGHRALRIRVLINASPLVVWQAIRDARNDDPDVQYSKITQINQTERILEQKYIALPFVGATTCVLKVEEDTGKRVDYRLMKSDRLAEFEGSWVLTPVQDDKATVMELSNHIKLKFPLPQKLVDVFANKKLKMRALFVKNKAEAKQLQVASNAE